MLFKRLFDAYWKPIYPETLMLVTHGWIKFKWEQDCQGCQIEKECPCIGNPNNGEYAYIEEKIKSFR